YMHITHMPSTMINTLSLHDALPILIRERSLRKETALNEINQQWGNELLIYGPVLEIPYKTFTEKTVTDKITKSVYTETIEKIERSEEHTSELQSRENLVCRLLLEKK